jgi:hypothetical protein
MSDYDGSMNRAKRVLQLAHDKGAKSEREKWAEERALMEAVIGAANSRWQTHESNHILDDCLIALNDYRNTSKGEG